MRQILYTSQSVRPMATADCTKILKSARENNERSGITGFLAYAPNGTFVQVIEGDADAIEMTYARISNDPRHYRVTTLMDTDGDERLFSEWSMGFRELGEHELDSLPGFVNLVDKDALSSLGEGPVDIDALKSIFFANAS